MNKYLEIRCCFFVQFSSFCYFILELLIATMESKKGNCSESIRAVDPSSEVAVSVSSFESDSAQDTSSQLVAMSSNSESNSAVDPSSKVAVSVSSFENDSAEDPSSELVDMSSNSGFGTGDPSSELVVNSSKLKCDSVENLFLGTELNILSFESDATEESDKYFAEVLRIAHSEFSTIDSDSDTTTLSEVDNCLSDLNSTIPSENTLISNEKKGLKAKVDAMEIASIEFRIRGSLVFHAGKSLPDTVSNVGENNINITIPPFTVGVRSNVTPQDNCKSTEHAGSNEGRDSAEIVEITEEMIAEFAEFTELQKIMEITEITESQAITEEMIASLLKHFKNNRYDAVSENRTDKAVLANCLHLYQEDYECERISNLGGTLSKFYPSEIIIPIKEKNVNYSECSNYIESHASSLKPLEFRNLAYSSSPSRCKTRFPVPVMLSGGKFICRAGTLSVRKGAFLEQLAQTKERKAEMVHDGITHTNDKNDSIPASRSNVSSFATLVNPSSMNQLKEQDVGLLKYLGVSVICDLMVEDRKIHTGVTVSSSEKVNKEKYEGFEILQMPYPGCEFFRKYHEAGRDPKGLKFDWGQRDVTTEFKLPEGFSLSPPATDFKDYKEWDIVRLTKEYLLLQLRVITSGNCGFLVHCVCGWDRTPLFITLLRLSLWADGLIHQTLTPLQMAYLTLGYDWYLFGHDLSTRLRNKEEVMHFCFNFISEIASDDFSMTREWHSQSEDSKDNRRVPPFNPCEREAKLQQVQKILLDLYEKQMDV